MTAANANQAVTVSSTPIPASAHETKSDAKSISAHETNKDARKGGNDLIFVYGKNIFTTETIYTKNDGSICTNPYGTMRVIFDLDGGNEIARASNTVLVDNSKHLQGVPAFFKQVKARIHQDQLKTLILQDDTEESTLDDLDGYLTNRENELDLFFNLRDVFINSSHITEFHWISKAVISGANQKKHWADMARMVANAPQMVGVAAPKNGLRLLHIQSKSITYAQAQGVLAALAAPTCNLTKLTLSPVGQSDLTAIIQATRPHQDKFHLDLSCRDNKDENNDEAAGFAIATSHPNIGKISLSAALDWFELAIGIKRAKVNKDSQVSMRTAPLVVDFTESESPISENDFFAICYISSKNPWLCIKCDDDKIAKSCQIYLPLMHTLAHVADARAHGRAINKNEILKYDEYQALLGLFRSSVKQFIITLAKKYRDILIKQKYDVEQFAEINSNVDDPGKELELLELVLKNGQAHLADDEQAKFMGYMALASYFHKIVFKAKSTVTNPATESKVTAGSAAAPKPKAASHVSSSTSSLPSITAHPVLPQSALASAGSAPTRGAPTLESKATQAPELGTHGGSVSMSSELDDDMDFSETDALLREAPSSLRHRRPQNN